VSVKKVKDGRKKKPTRKAVDPFRAALPTVDPALHKAILAHPLVKKLRKAITLPPGFDWGTLIAMLLSVIMSNVNKPPAPAPPPPAPAPPPPVPVPPPAPPAPPTGGPRVFKQIVTSLDLTCKGLKRGGAHIGGQELKAFKNGADAALGGDVVNFDNSPFDQNEQEIGPFGDTPHTDLDQLLVDPELGTYTSADPNALTTTGKKWPAGVDNHRCKPLLVASGGAKVSIAGEYRNYMQPNVKVEKDTGVGSFTLQVVADLADGRHVESDVLGPFLVKPA
jgi:hypothetical protein